MQFVLGTAQLVRSYGITAAPPPADEDSRARAVGILDAAWELGIRTLDTAPTYGDAEAVIGAASGGFTIHTKVAAGEDPRASLAASLGRTGRSMVDVLYLHDPDAALRADDPTLSAAAAMVGAGAGAVGASVYTAEQFDAAVADPRITVVQAPVNVLDRRIDDVRLTAAAAAGVRVFARSALLQGLLATTEQRALGRVPDLDAGLRAFFAAARHLDRTPLELALGWVATRPGLAGMVLGAESVEQVRTLADVLARAAVGVEESNVLEALPLPDQRAVDPRTWDAAGSRTASAPPTGDSTERGRR